ncbi:zwei Ig domain protein zig-8-like isoform X2 [Homalodisca vitripennis]|uniref:zwei Ig domain protein zig-8-like isoform X2 n=1 Tax=Homalodisca vitripennis TaxID=197043 RepID=UPI001EEC724B|nr:zwei Ig domain protein zig-8-like isoform X2 [Homalodisca vitripennis]
MKRHYSMELNIFVFLFLSHQGAAHTKRYLMNDVMQETPTPGAGPTFDTSVPGNLTGLVGKTAYLNCRVKNLGNRTVSWVRHRDIHLLTVGRYTYTSDQRFESVHSPHTEDWTLRIRYPQKEDSGTYECQISTTPPVGHPVYLSIVEPTTEIIGGPEMYINIGSTINLTCVVSFAPEPPPTVLWRHNRKLINFENSRGGISLVTEKGVVTRSRLLIQKADKADNGIYSCDPSTAAAATIHVHILNGEHPAAMHHGHGNSHLGPPMLAAFLLPILTNIFVNGLVL